MSPTYKGSSCESSQLENFPGISPSIFLPWSQPQHLSSEILQYHLKCFLDSNLIHLSSISCFHTCSWKYESGQVTEKVQYSLVISLHIEHQRYRCSMVYNSIPLKLYWQRSLLVFVPPCNLVESGFTFLSGALS